MTTCFTRLCLAVFIGNKCLYHDVAFFRAVQWNGNALLKIIPISLALFQAISIEL